MSLRLIFMGTPMFAVPTLRVLHREHEIVAVYTRAPKPGGRRGLELLSTEVGQEAHHLGIPVLTPSTLKTPEALDQFRTHNADAAVVVAYGMILPQAILDAPRLGCFNLHASLLPRWRGAAPINRAIMEGDAESGVMVMKMDAGLDTGDIALGESVEITDETTEVRLRSYLAGAGARPDAASNACPGTRHVAIDAAAERRRHLCRQDHQGRSAHRLEQASARGAAPYSRIVAVPRCLVRDTAGRRKPTDQDIALRDG